MFHVIALCKGIFLTRHLGRNERSIVNLALTLFKSCIENKIIHVIELCKEMLSTRHLEHSREISHYYLLANNSKSCKGLKKIKMLNITTM